MMSLDNLLSLDEGGQVRYVEIHWTSLTSSLVTGYAYHYPDIILLSVPNFKQCQ